MPLHPTPPWHAKRAQFAIVVALVAAATILAYLPALHGPYLLDDIGNLEPVKRWLDGTLSTRSTIFDNRSGPTGRPLSMLTFLADAWRTGTMDSSTFKPTNLAIHLICGGLIGILLMQWLRLGGERRSRDPWIALTVVTLWLWMPMHVSTVLYVVQRMAQLSTLWMLATLILYTYARPRLATDARNVAIAALWIGVPMLTIAAALSKENGVLALPLVGIVEWTMFADKPRSRVTNAFFVVTLLVPGLLACAYALAHLSFFVTSFNGRDFTVGERLLTESRILWSYLRTTFFPVGSRMGIFHDNYPLSTSLLAPASTAVSLAAWLALVVWAGLWRKRAPLFALGVFGYLVAHALEAGPIALELYFEHRNYLPSMFALVGCTGLLLYVAERYRFTATFGRLATCALFVMVAIFGVGTWNHASAWADADEFYALQYDYNPTSPRLLSVLTARAMIAKNLAGALARIDDSERYGPDSERATSSLWRLLAYCEVGGTPIPASLYDELDARAKGRVTQYAMTAWDLLANRVASGCPSIDIDRVGRIGTAWLERTPQPGTDQTVWHMRYAVARLLTMAGNLENAEVQAYRAWLDSNRNNGVSALVFQVSAALGHVDRCKEVLASLEHSYGSGDATVDDAVRQFREALPHIQPSPPLPATGTAKM